MIYIFCLLVLLRDRCAEGFMLQDFFFSLLLLLLVTLSLQQPNGLKRSHPSFAFDGEETGNEWHGPGMVGWVVD